MGQTLTLQARIEADIEEVAASLTPEDIKAMASFSSEPDSCLKELVDLALGDDPEGKVWGLFELAVEIVGYRGRYNYLLG